MRRFLLIMAAAAVAFAASVLIHSLIYRIWGIEEPVFFLIYAFVAPLMFMVGVAGSIVLFVRWIARDPKEP